jgi:hypothetical protein
MTWENSEGVINLKKITLTQEMAIRLHQIDYQDYQQYSMHQKLEIG